MQENLGSVYSPVKSNKEYMEYSIAEWIQT